MASKVETDIQVLRDFIQIYCEIKHNDRPKTDENNVTLCKECHETLQYSARRRELCPQNPKPTCKNCEIHCYLPEQRARIKEIMRVSGMALIKRGRIDLLLHYFF